MTPPTSTPAIARQRKTSSTKPHTLIIAEKPSVARDLIKCLDDTFTAKNNYFQGNAYIVSYAIGHLLTIAHPNEIDEKFKSWSLKNLPILPHAYPLKPIKNSKSQLTTLLKLIAKPHVTTIINACDAGREGELIFQYIIDYFKTTQNNDAHAPYSTAEDLPHKTIKRLWLQSMTEQAIRTSFQTLRDNAEMKHLSDAAKSRSEADWLVGINSSRGLTSFKSKGGGFFLTPCGRVQTPTLSMIIHREKIIENFKSEPYSTLSATFQTPPTPPNSSAATKITPHHYEGKWFDRKFKKSPSLPHARADRIFAPQKAAAISEKCHNKTGLVTESFKEASENCPLLYDLTTLQRTANSRYGYSAKGTLAILQSLYERHKITTYPRTSSRYLPEDYLGQVKKIVTALSKANLPKKIETFAQESLAKNYIQFNKRIFDNKKVSDHFAIIPTEKPPPANLAENERQIYTMILERFIAIFFPPAKSRKTTRITTIAEETFKTEGKIMLAPGWKVVTGHAEEDKILQKLHPDPNGSSKARCTKILEDKLHTKPPNRYNEASLLSAMEGAGKIIDDETLRETIKEKGIGTPATRATIIEKLIADNYIVKQARELIPTSKAFDLFKLIETIDIKQLTSPQLTGEWEYKLSLIEKGELSRDHFMQTINADTQKIIERIKNYNEEDARNETSFSPINGETFYKHLTYYTNANKTITIRENIGGRRMNEDEIATLIRNRKLGPFSDFRSRQGNAFSATIILNDSNKVELKFATQDDDLSLATLKTSPFIAKSYLDNSPVYKTDLAYVSESYLASTDKTKSKGIKLNRFILGQEITTENMQKMLAGEKTDLIQGFISNRTKRPFDAFLQLNDNAKISFSFPPRKSAKKSQS